MVSKVLNRFELVRGDLLEVRGFEHLVGVGGVFLEVFTNGQGVAEIYIDVAEMIVETGQRFEETLE